MQNTPEGLRVLVVGSDVAHNLGEVTDDFLQRGWTPQIVRMTDDEWTLRNVEDYVVYLSAVSGSTVPAQDLLNQDSSFPVIREPRSKFMFHLYELYTQLKATDNNDDCVKLAARQIIDNYLHKADQNPLVAVVLSETAWSWARTFEVWLKQLPDNISVYVMCPEGTLELVRQPDLTTDGLADIS